MGKVSKLYLWNINVNYENNYDTFIDWAWNIVLKSFFFTINDTSLDISDVDTVWTWGDKRPPHEKTGKNSWFWKKNSIRNMGEIALTP